MIEIHAALSILNLQYLHSSLKPDFIHAMKFMAATHPNGLRLQDIRDFFLNSGLVWPLSLEDEIQQRAEELFRLKQAESLKTLCFLEPQFPKRLLIQNEPCLFLSYFGHENWNELDFLAVVGSRDIQRETINWIQCELLEFLSRTNFGIVSGGALGADQAAHQVALTAGRPTLAFLPCGLGHIYPRQFHLMQSQIIQAGGAIVSEYPFKMPMNKGMFAHRNRLIAAQGVATLIVQASQRSGTLMTARLSAENGRAVFVVPGHPMSSHFLGSLQLIQEGATILIGASDLSEFLIAEKSFDLSSF